MSGNGSGSSSGAGAYNAAAWLLDRHVDGGRGERVVVRCGGDSSTYADVLRSVFRVQHTLDDLGLCAGDRVAMVVNDEPAFLSWFLGCLRSGVVPVPLSTMLKPGELGAIVADAGASVLVLSGEHAPVLAGVVTHAPHLRRAVVLDSTPVEPVCPVVRWAELDDGTEAPVAATTAASAAFWLYSSGTTGRPKGVMHRHGSPQATAETYAAHVLGIGPDDRCLSVAKLFFAYGLGNSLTFPLAVGATAVLNPARPTPAGVMELLGAERPTLFFASPGFVAALLDVPAPPEVFGSVRLSVTAGEALPAALQRRFTELTGSPVLDGLGTTEALHIFVSNTPGHVHPGTSGIAVPGYDVRLLDDAGDEVTAAGAPGYLHVRGPSLADGYWQRPDDTAAAFRGEWLRTGDVFARTDDGALQALGRNSDMIKAGGIWVSPAEVEAVLVEHPSVLESAVVGGRDDDGLETTVAFVVPRTGEVVDPDVLVAHCREHMAAFKRPRRIVVVDDLPKTATGKVQRYALRDRLAVEAGVAETTEGQPA